MLDKNLAAWLARHQLNVAELFEEHGVTLISDVQNLSVEDMEEIGLGSVEVGKLQAALAGSAVALLFSGSAAPPVPVPTASRQSTGSAGSAADSGDVRAQRCGSLVWRRSKVGDWEEGTGTEAEAAEAMAAATAELAVMARRPPSSSGSSSSGNDGDDDNDNDDSEVQEVAVKAVEAVAATGAGEWLEYVDDDGNPYYCNATTGETVWEKPVQEAIPQGASTDSGLPPAPPTTPNIRKQ